MRIWLLVMGDHRSLHYTTKSAMAKAETLGASEDWKRVLTVYFQESCTIERLEVEGEDPAS